MATDAARDLLALVVYTAPVARGRCRVIGTGRRRGEVGDILGDGMAGTDVGDAHVGGFAGLAEGVITGIEVFALLVRGKEPAVRNSSGQRGGGREARRMSQTAVGVEGRQREHVTHLELVLQHVLLVGHLPV